MKTCSKSGSVLDHSLEVHCKRMKTASVLSIINIAYKNLEINKSDCYEDLHFKEDIWEFNSYSEGETKTLKMLYMRQA